MYHKKEYKSGKVLQCGKVLIDSYKDLWLYIGIGWYRFSGTKKK